MDPFIGQITIFAGNFAPRGWAFCDGQLMPIDQNTSLFSILGTSFGGNGTSTFALPDLRGCVPMHPGHGAGLTPRTLGQRVGVDAKEMNLERTEDGQTADQPAPHSSVCVNFIIALEGIYPSRN
ncbi:MAG: tail fiber protein [Pseudomonadota bacterium]